MTGLINRQQAIDKFEPWLKVKGYSEGERNMLKAVLYELTVMPSAQPEPSIPPSWINEHIEWLKSLDNEFASLAAAHISVMVKKWRSEQEGDTK